MEVVVDMSLLLSHPTHSPTQLTNQPTNQQTTSQGAKMEDSCESCKKLCEEGESNKSQEEQKIYIMERKAQKEKGKGKKSLKHDAA